MPTPNLKVVMAELKSAAETGGDTGAVEPAGQPPNIPGVNERLPKLEGAFDWIEVTVALIATILVGGIAFVGVQVARLDARVSSLNEKVDGLPDRVNAGLRDLTSTLSQAITAVRQTAPQVILLPSPQLSAAPDKPTPQR